MRILIAEDDFTTRNMLAESVKKNGYEVILCADGAEAMTELQKDDSPKLALLDWMMPKVDGLEIIQKIRKIKSQYVLYIIMLTIKDNKNDIIKALDSGADDYLVKPFDMGELLARLNVGKRMMAVQDELAARIYELESANKHIEHLEEILPICSYCKKIRNNSGDWDQIEIYISEHSQTQFSHGICPDCAKIHHPEIYQEILENSKNSTS